MPRIRTIKPEFWNDEKLGQEPEHIMLTFIGMWNFADDYGVIRAIPLWLKNQIFPYKDKLRLDAFTTWLKRLVELEVIIPFTYKSESFYYIRTFRKHQKVEKPSKARHVDEADLLQILNNQGYLFNQEKELIKQSGSSRGMVGECSGTEIVIVGEEEKEIGKGGDGDTSSAKPQTPTQNIDLLNCYPKKHVESFERFKNWINEHAPAVAKMKKPFTIDEYLEIVKKLPAEKIQDLLKRMDNRVDLLKKNKSAYRTLDNWSKMSWNSGTTPQSDEQPGLSAATKDLLNKLGNGSK